MVGQGGEAGWVLLVAHHLVVDAVSWPVLLEDLESAYRQLSRGGEVALPPRTTSYRTWARRLGGWAGSRELAAEIPHWRAVAEAVAPLPVDGERRAGRVAEEERVAVALEVEETRALLQEVPRAYHTQVNDLLLTALALACRRWTGRPRLTVELEGHGREELFDGVDLSRTVGWFTALYPVALDLAGRDGPGEALKAVKEQLRAVPRRGVGYGVLRHLTLGRPLAGLPAPELSFNYLGQLDGTASAGGLWRPAPGPTGPAVSPRSPRPHLLAVNGGVQGGRLGFLWSFNPAAHRRQTVEALADGFLAALRELMEHCLAPGAGGWTPSDFPLAAIDPAALDRLAASGPLEDLYPLAPLQQGMLFHGLSDPATGVYLEQTAVTLTGELDAGAFRRAWQRVLERHPVLRTAFAWEGLAEPLQVVRPGVALPWRELDWRELDGRSVPPAEREARLTALMVEDRRAGLDLARAPLFRLTLVRTAATEHRLLWTHHHALLDGWSVPRLLEDLFAAYRALRRGREPDLPHRRPYRDYIAWLQDRDPEATEGYWRRTLAGFRAPTPLPGARPAPAPAGGYRVLDRPLAPAAAARLAALARRQGLTLSSLVQGAWSILLARTSGEKEVLFGLTTAGRPAELAGSEAMLGLFINTLPARVRVTEEEPLSPWLRRLQAELAEARQHEHAPLSRIRAWSELPPGVELFETLFVFENYPVTGAFQGGAGTRDSGGTEDAGGLGFRIGAVEAFSRTNFPLTVVASPGLGGEATLTLRVAFEEARVEPTAGARLLGWLAVLLEGMASAPEEATLRRLPVMTAAERHQILAEWSDRPEPAPGPRLLHRLFELQADRRPEAVALVGMEEALTYGEVEARAQRLAHRLGALGVEPEGRVGVCLPRGPEIGVALLAVLKAGGAYVPLDPSYPPERLAYMLADAAPGALLTAGRAAEVLRAGTVPVLRLDGEAGALTAAGDARPAPRIRADNLAYVIYTSGSTGKPKGVMVSHRSIARRTAAMAELYDLGPGDRQLQFVALGFDVLGEELYTPLARGGSVLFHPDPAACSAAELLAWAESRKVTKINAPASYWHQMADELEALGRPVPASLRILTTGAESPSRARLRSWAARAWPGHRWYNVYGPTEGTILVTAEAASLEPGHLAAGERIPIGRPLPDAPLYLVDRWLRPVPAGVPGELAIGGLGVARGYLGRPALTAGRFRPDPFGRPAGGRLYHTGDLARWLPDGRIEFLGRDDSQVKIRGYRIELEEVEAALTAHPAVAAAAVVVREETPGDRRLVAYLAPRETPAPAAADLRAFLGRRLPPYMVPAAFVVLEALPRTATGKLDRRALPDPDADVRAGAGPDGRRPYAPPRTPAEETLAAIWAQVLGRPAVGVDDDFFELGGDSILSIQIASRAAQAGLRLSPRQLFEHPTVAALAAVAGREAEAGAADAEQGPVTGEAPLTPIQRWFFELGLDHPGHWNQGLLFQLPAGVAPGHAERAVAALVAHHDALRLTFSQDSDAREAGAREGGGWRQQIGPPPVAAPFLRVDLSGLPAGSRRGALEAVAARLQAGFDLVRGPLFRVVWLGLGTGEPARLFLLAHHLCVDGVSWRILLEDLETAYRQVTAGEPVQLPAKTTSFQRWARQLAEHAASPAAGAELERWRTLAAAEAPRLPRDQPGGSNRVAASRSLTVALGREETQALLAEVPPVYRTRIDDLLLAALARAFAPWTGSRRLRVDLEGHGREELFDGVDLSRTVGWLTCLYPVLLELPPEGGPGAAIKAVKEQLRAVPGKGLGYGVLRYLSPRAESPSYNDTEGGGNRGGGPGAGAQERSEESDEACDGERREEGPRLSERAQRASSRAARSEARSMPVGSDPATAEDPGPPEPFGDVPPAEVAFNYLGQLDRVLEGSALLAPARENPGPAGDPRDPRSHLLEVNAQVVGGRLRAEWRYSGEIHRRETVQALADRFIDALGELVAHCRSPEAGGCTPSDFPLAGLDAATVDRLAGDGRTVEDLYPLSPLQEGLLLHALTFAGSGVGFEQTAARLTGELDAGAFREAWRRTFQRHPVLRTAFAWEGLARPLQVVHRRLEPGWRQEDWQGLSRREQEERLEAFLAADVAAGFDLARPPLMRLALLATGPAERWLVWSFHHTLLDGWSGSRVLADVFALYGELAGGPPAALTPARPYRDYVAWLGRREPERAEAFWRASLAGLTAPTPVASGRLRAPEGGRGDAETRLGATATAALESLVRGRGLTLASAVQAAWGLLLGRRCGSSDVLFGVTVSGRPAELPGVESMVGLFINTLPLRLRLPARGSTADWLRRVRERQAELGPFEATPLAQVQEWSELPASLPLFDSLLVFENYPVAGSLRAQAGGGGEGRADDGAIGTLAVDGVRSRLTAGYPFTLVAQPGAELILRASYDRRQLETTEVDRLLADLRELLEALAADPERPVTELAAPAGAASALPVGAAQADTPRDLPRIAGYRLDTGWLRRRLEADPAVAAAWVTVTPGPDDAVWPVAYLEPVPGAEVDPDGLRSRLRRELLPPLVPAAFVVLESLPRGTGGEIDEAALPPPRERRPQPGYLAPRDSLELRLTALMEGALGMRPIGVRDSFFDLGGTSLLAIHLLAEVRRHFQADLPLSVLFEAPSVEGLAQVLRRPETFRRSGAGVAVDPLVVIQPGTARPPFFCVHPGGGSVLSYARLARHLGADQPFYALQAVGVHGEAEPQRTVEEMAALYLKVLRRTQPAGPYLLGGWSFGALVALEVAQRLLADGREVALLAILDQPPIAPERPPGYDDSDMIRDVLPADFPLSAQELRSLGPLDRQLQVLLDHGHREGTLPPGFGLAEARRNLDLLNLHQEAAESYRPRPYPGRLTLLRASEQMPEFEGDPTLGWAPLTPGGIDVIQVPGDHQNMMNEPRVQTLAAQLRDCLERARAGCPAETGASRP